MLTIAGCGCEMEISWNSTDCPLLAASHGTMAAAWSILGEKPDFVLSIIAQREIITSKLF